MNEDNMLCTHDWVDTYGGNGMSRHSPDKYIIWFFCKKCLETRKKIIDISDQLVSPDTLELYEEDS